MLLKKSSRASCRPAHDPTHAPARAKYTELEDGSWSAHVRELRGVLATGPSIEACRAQLGEAVEEWILVRVARGLAIPRIGGVTIRVRNAR